MELQPPQGQAQRKPHQDAPGVEPLLRPVANPEIIGCREPRSRAIIPLLSEMTPRPSVKTPTTGYLPGSITPTDCFARFPRLP